MNDTIKLGNQPVGSGCPPFIVAEMSGNHNQSLDRALRIVQAAADAGVNAVKLQTYTADTLTIDADGDDFIIHNSHSPWRGKSLYELYKEAYTPWEWHQPIFEKCRELGLVAFSTPFDEKAVDFLEKLDVPAYKISSFENNHLPLIRKAASTGKPLIISTGTADITEIAEAVETARLFGCNEIILLKCTSSYPAPPEESNLLTIPHMKDLFGTPVGISDHTLGVGVSIASIALGAALIEKHFTISRTEGGVDSPFSMEPDEMRLLVEEAAKAFRAIGSVVYKSVVYKSAGAEETSARFKRSVYVVDNVKKGDSFTENNLRIIRPGFGLAPKYLPVLLNKRASCDIKRGTAMSWDFIE